MTLLAVEIDRPGVERIAEKLAENAGTESFRADRIGAEVMTTGRQHQLGAAGGAQGREGWAVDIDHQVLPLCGVVGGQPYVWQARDARPVVWRQKFAFSSQPFERE